MRRIICSAIVVCGFFYALPFSAAPAAGDTIRCHSDNDCQRPQLRGACVNPGKENAGCIFQEIIEVPCTVIIPDACRTCQTDTALKNLQEILPGLKTRMLKSSDPEAAKLIKDFKIEMLPAYLLSKEAQREPNFTQVSSMSEFINGQYYLKPSFTGVSYFIGRAVEPGRLDLFVLLTGRDTAHLLDVSKKLMDKTQGRIKFQLNLVGATNPETAEILSPGGIHELNEDRIYGCVDKYYPPKAWDYLSCRVSDVNSLWWEECLLKNAVETDKIKECAKGREADALVREKIKLAEELRIAYAPFFLLDNVEIFGAAAKTTVEELEGVISTEPPSTEDSTTARPPDTK